MSEPVMPTPEEMHASIKRDYFNAGFSPRQAMFLMRTHAAIVSMFDEAMKKLIEEVKKR